MERVFFDRSQLRPLQHVLTDTLRDFSEFPEKYLQLVARDYDGVCSEDGGIVCTSRRCSCLRIEGPLGWRHSSRHNDSKHLQSLSRWFLKSDCGW